MGAFLDVVEADDAEAMPHSAAAYAFPYANRVAKGFDDRVRSDAALLDGVTKRLTYA